MVYKVYKKNNYIIIIDENNNYLEEHCANVLVTKLLTPSTTYDITFFRTESVPQAFYSIPFANIRDEAGAPYASVATWESWYTLNTGLCSNAAVLNSILATLQAQTDVEGVFVRDTGNFDKIVLQVKVWDQDSQQYIAIYYYNPDGTLYTPVGPLEWVGPGGSVNATIISPLGNTTTCGDAVAVTYCAGQATEFFDQGDTLDSILTELTTGILDVNITNSTLAVTQSGVWNINAIQSGTWTVALDAATLLALETITVNQGTSPWVVSATNFDIRDLTFATDTVNVSGSNVNAVVTATNLDIRDLSCTTDSIAICDGAGNALAIDTNGHINSNLYGLDANTDNLLQLTATPNGICNALDVNICGPKGSQDCDDSLAVSLCSAQAQNLLEIKDAVTGTLAVGGTVAVSGISDGTDSLEINTDGSINVNTTIDCATSSIAICADGLPVGLLNQLPVGLYADDLVSLAPERLTTTGGPTYQALDVNQVPFVRTPNIIYGIASGFIAVPVYSITFFNAGPSIEVIYFDGGITPINLPAGISISMDAGGNNTYASGVFGYDVVGDGPIIITYNS